MGVRSFGLQAELEFEAHFLNGKCSSLLLTATSSRYKAQTRPFENDTVLGLRGWERQRFSKDENFLPSSWPD